MAEFVAAMGRQSGRHLIELVETIDELPGNLGMIDRVKSFRDFETLQRAELDIAIFGRDWPAEVIPKLKDILPPTLQSLYLFDSGVDDNTDLIGLLLQDFSAGRDWLLSDLDEIVLRRQINSELEGVTNLDKVKAYAEAAGVDLREGENI